MSGAAVSLLTAPGSAAIAVVEVRGPRAYSLTKQLFAPAGKPLPESPDVGRFWFGTLGSDEVVLSVTEPDAVVVHCHGGLRVVRWVIEQFTAHGAEERTLRPKAEGFELLQRAPTLRTASILLDQLNGAFALEVQHILRLLETDPDSVKEPLSRLAELGNTVGRHLVEPWKVVIAGPPNVGKSSLVNALAGYQRAVVSEIAGTTRDAVGVRVAFDGWPVELTDTAGLRDSEGLEAEGITRARRVLGEANFVVWVNDASLPEDAYPDDETDAAVKLPQSTGWVLVKNKSDLSLYRPESSVLWAIYLSAATGENVPLLADRIVRRLVPVRPAPGDAVPFTPRLIELINAANASNAEAARLLREALAVAKAHHFG